jgi:hypothetical protein
MRDYSIFYRHRFAGVYELATRTWDRFVSAFDGSDRVTRVFDHVIANEKHFLNLPEYKHDAASLPVGCFQAAVGDEAEAIGSYFDAMPIAQGRTLCVDISGFLRPHLIYLLRYLSANGIKKFDALYAEPSHYAQKAETTFAHENIAVVRQIAGYEGQHSIAQSHDVLILGAGYENHLVTRVAERKANARKIRLLGYPSLQADMYQESVLRLSRSAEALGEQVETLFAPAYDPFVAATVISRRVGELENAGLTNLYLAPLSTKPHTLGFAIFYLYERLNTPTSIIFPFSESYAAQSSRGISRVWQYTVELP